MTLTAMLLAGGESRRMGFDKGTLMLANEPMWQRQLHLLRQLQPQCLWLSARGRPAWCPADIHVVVDEPPSRGPLSGIAAALSCLKTSHLFALAVDMPRMTASYVKRLLDLAGSGCGVVPVNDILYEPLCAVYPSEAGALANQLLQENRFSLQHFVKLLLEGDRLTPYRIGGDERAIYCNANEPTGKEQF